jgi:hypothetical protein
MLLLAGGPSAIIPVKSSRGGRMVREQKQLLYIYDGDQTKLDDVELDIDGELRVPEKQNIIERKGRKWEVIQITKTTATDGRLPVYQVYLRSHGVH